MRILHVIDSVNPRGGGPMEGVNQRAKYMAQMGHTVEVACCDDPAEDYIQSFSCVVHAFGPTVTHFRYTPRLKKWLSQNLDRFDGVVINGLWQYHGVAGAAACRKAGKRYWVFPHGMLDPWFKKNYPIRHLRKVAMWPWQYKILREADAVLFTSEEEKLLARGTFKPYKVTERVVSYGAGRPRPDDGTQKAAFLAAYPALRGKPFLLFLSRIHAKKGCDLLLQAFDQVAPAHPDLHLVMAGPVDPEYKPVLDQIHISPELNQRVIWTGMLSGPEKYGAFRAASAFVLPSHQENFGISIAEALACGKPVLISNKVNIWREIEMDGAGIVADDDLKGTVDLLQKWTALKPIDQEKMSARALACYEERFTMERACEDLIELVRNFASGGSRGR